MMAGSHNAFSMSLVSSLGNVLPRAKETGFGPSVEMPVSFTRHGIQNTLITLVHPPSMLPNCSRCICKEIRQREVPRDMQTSLQLSRTRSGFGSKPWTYTLSFGLGICLAVS